MYLSVDLENCHKAGHHFRLTWKDSAPLKVSLMCLTCCNSSGKVAYAAYGDDTNSWGPWRSKKREIKSVEPMSEEEQETP